MIRTTRHVTDDIYDGLDPDDVQLKYKEGLMLGKHDLVDPEEAARLKASPDLTPQRAAILLIVDTRQKLVEAWELCYKHPELHAYVGPIALLMSLTKTCWEQMTVLER
jgi:hypothetical protein